MQTTIPSSSGALSSNSTIPAYTSFTAGTPIARTLPSIYKNIRDQTFFSIILSPRETQHWRKRATVFALSPSFGSSHFDRDTLRTGGFDPEYIAQITREPLIQHLRASAPSYLRDRYLGLTSNEVVQQGTGADGEQLNQEFVTTLPDQFFLDLQRVMTTEYDFNPDLK